MANVKILALGGLAEFGKNLYVVEVEGDIVVLDCGAMAAGHDLLGVDHVIPDFTYLIENKERVKAIFLTNPNYEMIGSVHELIKQMDIPIYCSRFTSLILVDKFKDEKIANKNQLIHILKDEERVKLSKNLEVSVFQTTYSIPETLAICVHTADGVIVYTGEYNLKPKFNCLYKTNHKMLSKLGSEGVLCFLGESIGCGYTSNSESDYLLNHHLKEAFKLEKRLIISTYSNDFSKIQKIVDLCVEFDKKLGIIGRKAQRILDIGINEGYLNIPDEILLNLKFIDQKNKNYSTDMVILVTGEKHEPYYMLQRIARKRDKLIHLQVEDQVIILTIPNQGIEKMAATTSDLLYRLGAKVTHLDKKILRSSHASVSNTMSMYSLLSPKYIMPVIGEYRHQYSQKSVAENCGYIDHNIVMGKNGEVFTFVDGIKSDSVYEVFTSEVLIDGALVGDVNEVVLKDREYLSEDGLIMLIVNIDARKKKILNKTEIISSGFITEKEEETYFLEITEIFEKTIKKHFQEKYVDWQELKSEVKDEINRYIFKKIKRRTLVIPTIIDTQT